MFFFFFLNLYLRWGGKEKREKESEQERETVCTPESSGLLSNACNAWEWAEVKARATTQVSDTGGTGTQSLEPSLLLSRVYISRELESETGARCPDPASLVWDLGILIDILTARPNAHPGPCFRAELGNLFSLAIYTSTCRPYKMINLEMSLL